VSDVVATILLLALTVTLFASIFAFVTAFPSPPAQNNNQFQAALIVTPNGTYVSSIQILHLAGPAVAGTALVYLKSATQPAAAEFTNPYTVASEVVTGIATVTGANSWNLGQVWNITFNQYHMPAAGGNITVYVVAGSQLLFSVILPGAITATPPTIVSTATVPATPAVGVPFTVYATLAGSYTPYSVYINLAAMPGGPSTSKLMTQNSQGQWTYLVSSGATAAGTFYGFVNASSSAVNGGQQATGAVVITIASTGTTNGPLSVGVILVPSPANPGTAESVQAVVTYTGPVLPSAQTVTVSFSATSNPTGYTFSGTGPSGVKISGPGGPASVTVTSQSTWTIPGPNSVYSYTVSATATVTTVGSITGNTSFTPALLVLSPASGLVGSTVTATGSAFSTVSGSTVTLAFGGVAVTPSACSSGTLSGAAITPASGGGFVCTFTVPNGAPAGAATAVATDAFSGQSDFFSPYTVTAWTISPLAPTSGLVGSSVTVTATGFAGTSGVTLAYNGVAITVASCTSGTAGATITTTAAGGFVCKYTVPAGTASGAGSLVASDTTYTAQTTSAPFTVTPWTMALSPTSGLMGSSVTVTATNFAASSSVTLAFDAVSLTTTAPISLACTVGSASGATITTSAAGAFTCTFNVPYGATAGAGSLVATDASGPTTVTASYSVTPWTISLSPTTSASSITITITGAGFAPGSVVFVSNSGIAGDDAWNAACTTGTGASGAYSVTTSAAGAFVCTTAWTVIAHIEILTFTATDSTTGQVAVAYFSDTD
jgi:hypothetical protein